ncbi:MAG TPA: cysteine-rich CWC family protein [Chthoniobacteraceae bacterium]|nr:cysteine-rich CWC family protein [Chthoniobacteraceae bacterium]
MPESNYRAPERLDHGKLCVAPNCCPVCAGPNECRMETGEGFKGACWCAGLSVSAAALERLLGHVAERRCLCRSCLERIAADPAITWDELTRLEQ